MRDVLFPQKPKGLLMTPFVINLAKPFLKYMETSLIEYGHPCGLIALILVAVSRVCSCCGAAPGSCSTMQLERAVRAFETTGEFEDPGMFNSSYKALLTEYLESVNAFNKWDNFYAACDFVQDRCNSHGTLAADISQIDIGRRDLNFSSSPIRE